MDDLIEQLKAIVGPRGWITDRDDLAPHLTDWRGAVTGSTPVMVSPATTGEVAAVVRACADAGVAIVPQGGNTGMCAGSVPDESGGQVLLNLGRLNRIRNVDAANYSIEVEAGCVLDAAQGAARQAGRYLPLSLGAEGSCQIGGNLATDAGGINVIRYGTARSLALGLEVVLADGTVLDTMRSLRKDTAGYDVKQLFIGSEGTLGIITAATLRLFPEPGETVTALAGVRSSGDSVSLLAELRSSLSDRIESFELISQRIFTLLEKHIPGARLPLDEPCPWYVLMEVDAHGDHELLESALLSAAESGLVSDAVIAKNVSEADKLWRMRHSISEAEKQEGPAQKHDISVPLSRMQEFLTRGDDVIADVAPDAQLLAFGHVGDGNLHYNVQLPADLDDAQRERLGEAVTRAVYDLVAELGGSFSAEHGVGRLKRAYVERYKSGPEIALMRQLKATLDPLNILNPGKVI